MANEKKPEGFYVFGETEELIGDISDSELGRIFRRMLAWHNRGVLPMVGDLKSDSMIIFKLLKTKANAHQQKTIRIKKRQSEATSRRWAKEKGKRIETNSDYKRQEETNSDNTSYPILSSPILSKDYTSKYSPLDNKKNVASAASASEERRSGQGEPPPAEVVQKILGGLARVRSSEESQKELDEAGFFSMSREEKAAYLEKRRRLKKEERKAENEN